MPEPAGEFRFRHPVPVRFRDLDLMGHVHHSVALVYFEEARAAYWRDVAGQGSGAAVGYLIGDIAVRYLARIHFPATLDVGVRATHMGSKSWDMEYEVRAPDGTVVVAGRSTQVMYDYEAETSVPIPDEIRRRIAAFEGL